MDHRFGPIHMQSKTIQNTHDHSFILSSNDCTAIFSHALSPEPDIAGRSSPYEVLEIRSAKIPAREDTSPKLLHVFDPMRDCIGGTTLITVSLNLIDMLSKHAAFSSKSCFAENPSRIGTGEIYDQLTLLEEAQWLLLHLLSHLPQLHHRV